MAKALHGVNLGGWLVLEPWITPSLFKGTNNAPDEFTYCDEANPERFHQLKEHHETWIAKQDFQWIAEQGFDAVRIPVGYWIFGNITPYVGAITYLDRAFEWAGEFDLKVLLCLHGAPGSQNGKMHSGKLGTVGWGDDTNIAISLQTVSRLAERYKDKPMLLGIELLNEPSSAIPRRKLMAYYRQAHAEIRRICGAKVWVVFSDRFAARKWWWVLHWPLHSNAVLDVHHYQIFSPQDKALDMPGHIAKAVRQGKILRLMSWHRKVIVGEWSATLDPQSCEGLEGQVLDVAYRAYVQAQLQAFGSTNGWFYWTYRTEDKGPWNLRSTVDKGIFFLSK